MGRVLIRKYEVLRPLGAGGAGKVYLAWDRHLSRLVVVKESREEFLLPETELLRELRHPGLPQIYDCFREEESSYLVMEYIEGMSLRQYLDRYERAPQQQALRWAQELCGILGYLHSRHPAVIYRDLKPENIMVCQDGSLKLIDFGGAIRCAFGGERQGLCVGTAGYCPEEQWRETGGEIGWDIYALGAVLHEMLTGANPSRPPYERRPIQEYDRSLPGALERIIRISTSRDASERYPSMEAFAQALRRQETGRRQLILAGWTLIRRLCLSLMGGCTAICFFLPLVRGIPETDIPFPYLEKPLILLMLTLILYLLFSDGLLSRLAGKIPGYEHKRSVLRRHEKNIWLTEKKFSGLLLLFLFLAGKFSPLPLPESAVWELRAGQREERLWVEIRDDQGRKMLLKEGAVYRPADKVRFELPAARLPGQRLALQFVAVGEDGTVYNSRVFYIMAREADGQEQGGFLDVTSD